MHLLLGLSSVLLVALGGALTLVVLQRLGRSARRRDLQLLVLAMPVMSLALSLGGLYHFVGRLCFLDAPPWDAWLSMALPLIMGGIAFGALSMGVVRLTLMAWVVGRKGTAAGDYLQARVDGLADQLEAIRPRLLLCVYDRPLALTYGPWRPTILLSTWMVDHLDRHELEAVVAHELGHVARHDYLVIWLATVLRDAFWYLPASWVAYQQLKLEKEFASDDLAVRATRRPLALASALTKVWQHAVDRPRFGVAQSLVRASELIEGRITRLLDAPAMASTPPSSRMLALGVGMAALAGLLALQAANVAIILTPMGCGPGGQIWNIL